MSSSDIISILKTVTKFQITQVGTEVIMYHYFIEAFESAKKTGQPQKWNDHGNREATPHANSGTVYPCGCHEVTWTVQGKAQPPQLNLCWECRAAGLKFGKVPRQILPAA